MKQSLALPGLMSLVLACGGKDPAEDYCDDTSLFDSERVLQVDITMDDEDWDSLRYQSRSIVGELSGDCRSGPFKGDYTYFPATIDIDGESASNIGIRKKGFIGSQSTEKPGFRINLDEYVEDTKLFCTDNITLNNSVQDPSLMRQCLTYKVFQDAGIAAPRCSFARVSMNGQDLGIYVNIEPVKKKFLRENFSDDEGDLYEGTLTDFEQSWYSTFDPKTDETDLALGPIRSLADDLEDSSDELETILRRHFDYDQLLTFLSAEVWTGHWDGYGGNQNNFYVYRDTEADKLSFIPWGADGTMNLDQNREDETWFPTQAYLVQRILSDESVAEQWFRRLGELRDTAWDPEALKAEINRMEALLGTEIPVSLIADQADELRSYVDGREEAIRRVLPVTEVYEFGSPFCMVEMGFIEADFSTTWTEASPDLEVMLEAGGADLTLNWAGYDIDMRQEGAHAGQTEEDEYGQLILAGGFEGESGQAFVLPVFYFEVDALEDGLELDLDWGAGNLLFMDETTGWEPVQLGEFWGGTVRFDVASPVEGAEVTGSIYADIYTWQEVGG